MAGEALRIDLGTVADAAGSATVAYDGASVSVACRLEPARRDGLTIDCEVESAAFDAPRINGDDVARALKSCLAPGGPKAFVRLRAVVLQNGRGELCAACMAASLALCDADIPLRGLCGGGCVELGEGAVAVVALGDGVVASRMDGAGDTAAALDEALGAAAAARGRMRAALVERLSSG